MEQSKTNHWFIDHHKKIKGLADQLRRDTLTSNEMRAGVARELLMELCLDFNAKSQIYYPALKDKLQQLSDLAVLESHLKSIQQLQGATQKLLRRFPDLSKADLSKEAEFSALIQDAVEQFHREEIELYPKVIAFSDENSHLNAIQVERDKVAQLPEFRDAIASKVQNPHGGEQKRIAS